MIRCCECEHCWPFKVLHRQFYFCAGLGMGTAPTKSYGTKHLWGTRAGARLVNSATANTATLRRKRNEKIHQKARI